jgi:oxygen-dependent protoporphyrinogen oxidase
MLALNDEEMLRRITSDLAQLISISGEPLFAEVSRWIKSMPQYEVGHLQLVDEIEARALKLPGLTLAGNALRGAGIPDCIRSGESAASTMLELP